MTRLRTNLGLVLALAAATPCAWAQGSDSFKEGVDLMARGRQDEALVAFQTVLAAEPSAEEAYEIWKSTDDARIWLDMLTMGGEFELVAKRIMDLARQGRIEKRNRRAEKQISAQYIAELNKAYNYFFFHYQDTPLLAVNTTNVDFVSSERDFEALLRQIEQLEGGTRYYVPE